MASCLSKQEKGLLDAYASDLRSRFGERLRQVVLFGSRARGTGRADSDLDVLVLVDDLHRAERREIIDLAADLSLAWGLVLSPLVSDAAAWRRDLPIARTIDAEGIPL